MTSGHDREVALISHSTLVDLLRWRASIQPDRLAYTFLSDGETEEGRLTYSELDRKARSIGAKLQSMGLAGERALLLYPPGLEYIAAFWGCLYAGVVAVPAYPPQNKRNLPRLLSIISDAGAKIALLRESFASKMTTLFAEDETRMAIPVQATDIEITELAEQWEPPKVDTNSLAFLQYTSGSTGKPKGVMLSHGNLLHNLFQIQQGFSMTGEDIGVIWLPPYHDMGLIGGILEPLFSGSHCVLMPPAAFLQRPLRWLEAISKYRGTVSGGPNFAYDFCVRKISPEQTRALDLSSWAVAFNGAEPVRAETMERFAAAFANCGFHRRAFYPCFGLAEATLIVSGIERENEFVARKFRKIGVEGHRVEVASEGEMNASTLIGCGRSIGEQTVKVVHPETRLECESGEIGEIWVKGRNVAQGYWGKEEESTRVFKASIADTGESPFMRTEDLGFFHEGELFVTGRIKDLIIIRGVNHYPQDIEQTVGSCHPSLRPGGGAAFSVDIAGEERLIIAHEVEFREKPDIQEVASAVRQAVAEEHDIQLYALVLINPGRIPKTSSGKIQRYACREGFLNGTLDSLGEWRLPLDGKEEEPEIPFEDTEKSEPKRVTIQATKTQQEIIDWLVTHLSARLKVAARDIDIWQPFARYGLDSVNAVALAGDLEAWLGFPLAPTLAYDYPTIEALSRHLAGEAAISPSEIEPAMGKKDEKEPIAIVGIGCRFPMAENADAFWRLLSSGMDAISEVPPNRWDPEAFYSPDPDEPGKMITRHGGFLSDVDQFDPHFFGISPREATRMDPQQRLILEVAWEALEDAGIAPDKIAGSKTGVFIGISNHDYSLLQHGDPSNIDVYTGTGNAFSIASNRLSYTLDLHGPSLAVDTACSSSLVALHLACQSLNKGDSSLAIAGGVNVILTPELNIAFSHARMMAADGRCKTFDAKADGYIRGEGCGIVVLKRLSDAIKDGDHIWAVIRGSAVNQDGRSNGITAPNGLAQQLVIQQALNDAQILPAQIDYVEAHGTGTILGDPIEVQALGTVLQGRSKDRPCLIGSVKTNIGHLEAAAGIAGLIKVVLALKHEEIPPHLHFQELNPHIPLDQLPLKITTGRQPWSAGTKPRVAGISSFGFGGTNAHIVVEEAPAMSPKHNEIDRPLHLLCLSARDEKALRELAARFEKYLANHTQEAIADICHTANTGRTHFAHRLAAMAPSSEEARATLSSFVSGQQSAKIQVGQIQGASRPLVAFLFTGQGAQHIGMGRQLYDTQPTFRKALDKCAQILEAYLEKPLLSVIFPEDGAASPIDETAYTQPALFAIEYALAEMWQSWGITPDYVIGHSVGEYVAACVAGVFSLEDGLKLIAARGRLMQSLPQDGEMAAIFADHSPVAIELEPFKEQVSIAGVNGPDNTVISGKKEAIQVIAEKFRAAGIESRPLNVSHAFHSPLMEPILDEFEKIASEIRYSSPRIGLISNLTGKLFDFGFWNADGSTALTTSLGMKSKPDETLNPQSAIRNPQSLAAYWRQHIREAVQFYAGMQTLAEQGCEIFLELGPNPVLLGMGRRCLPDSKGSWLPSLKQGKDDWQVLLSSLGSLYTKGLKVNWSGFDQDYPRKRLPLPTYPFQRARYWNEAKLPTIITTGSLLRSQAGIHPLLGQRMRSPVIKEVVFASEFSVNTLPLLSDHRVFGMPIFPATAFLEMALAAAKEHFGTDTLTLEDVAILQAMTFTEDEVRNVQVILNPENNDQAALQIFSSAMPNDGGQESWKLHAICKIHKGVVRDEASQPSQNRLQELQTGFHEQMEIATYYEKLRERGLEYGPSFQGIRQLWPHDGEALGLLQLPEEISEVGKFYMHPALLDAGFQLLAAILSSDGKYADSDSIYLPVGLKSFRLFARSNARLWSHVTLGKKETANYELLLADLNLYSDDGQLVAEIEGLQLKRTRVEALMGASKERLHDWLYEIKWQLSEHTASDAGQGNQPGSWIIFGDNEPFGTELANLLSQHGQTCIHVIPGDSFGLKAEGHWQMNPSEPDDYRRLLAEALPITDAPLRGVVHAWSLNVDSTMDMDNAQEHCCGSVLHLVQSLVTAKLSTIPQLWLVTRGAQAVNGSFEPLAVPQSSLWGLGNVIAWEHPELRCVQVDLDPDATATTNNVQSLFAEVWSDSREDHVAFRNQQRYVARLQRVSKAKGAATENELAVPADQPYRLEITSRGVLDNLKFESSKRRKPGANEVEIHVRATGLNFRDVLNALGLYPGDPGPLGGECAGEVVAIGENVNSLKVGDAVIAIAPASFSNYVTTYADLAIKKPAHLSLEEAATIPIPFLTAYYALHHLGKISAGDRLFIHSASGGVGLAAIQLAQKAGAEIFATAGSPEKREFLKSLGVQHVMNSRSLDFAAEVMDITQGRGVDLVLNSLAGEYIPKSLSILASKGRFLEIGKAEIWDESRVAQVKSDVSYFAIALDDLSRDNPALIQAMLRDLMAEFASGSLKPLPGRVFPIAEVVSAFRFMAQAKHIGKIVVSQKESKGDSLTKKQDLFRSDATYLITGGFGQLGILVARWMVEHGARHLVLAGLGEASAAASNAIDELRQNGAQVVVMQANIAIREQTEKMLADIAAHRLATQTPLPPLRGLIHAAGLLDDGVLMQQNWQRFAQVMAPKVSGSWNLHTLTKDMPLDFFVFFSSVASLLGSPGQGNYAAANAFMDGLAHRRRAQGLPAISINWGPWAVGMAAGLDARGQRRHRASGMGFISPDQGLQLLEMMLLQDTPQIAALPVNWPAFVRSLPSGEAPPILSDLVHKEKEKVGAQKEQASAFRQQLEATAPSERKDLLVGYLCQQATKVLGLEDSFHIDPHQPLREMGLDSLMAIELKNAVVNAIGRDLPATLLFNYPTIDQLAEYLVSEVLFVQQPKEAPEGTAQEQKEPNQGLADVKDLSEEEVEALLADKLTALEKLN